MVLEMENDSCNELTRSASVHFAAIEILLIVDAESRHALADVSRGRDAQKDRGESSVHFAWILFIAPPLP